MALLHSASSTHPGGGVQERANGGLLTAGPVAELLGVPKSWVYEQSRAGRTPTVALGRYRRYRREAIEEWVARIEKGWPGAHTAPRGT